MKPQSLDHLIGGTWHPHLARSRRGAGEAVHCCLDPHGSAKPHVSASACSAVTPSERLGQLVPVLGLEQTASHRMSQARTYNFTFKEHGAGQEARPVHHVLHHVIQKPAFYVMDCSGQPSADLCTTHQPMYCTYACTASDYTGHPPQGPVKDLVLQPAQRTHHRHPRPTRIVSYGPGQPHTARLVQGPPACMQPPASHGIASELACVLRQDSMQAKGMHLHRQLLCIGQSQSSQVTVSHKRPLRTRRAT